MIQPKMTFSLIAAAVLAGTGLSAQASSTTFGGTQQGGVVRFVLDTDTTGAFGTPTYQQFNQSNGGGGQTGSSLKFQPEVFRFDAEAGYNPHGGGGKYSGPQGDANHGAVDRERAGFQVRIEAAKGYEITGIHWSEDGFFDTRGNSANVGASAFLRAQDGTTGEHLFRDAKTVSYHGDNANYWDLSADHTLQGGSGKVDLTVKNILIASAAKTGDFAWIEKDFADLKVSVEQRPGANPGGFPAPVPLPASLWLLGSAIASVVTIGRRRQETLAA